jgi:hypothetical protein
MFRSLNIILLILGVNKKMVYFVWANEKRPVFSTGENRYLNRGHGRG